MHPQTREQRRRWRHPHNRSVRRRANCLCVPAKFLKLFAGQFPKPGNSPHRHALKRHRFHPIAPLSKPSRASWVSRSLSGRGRRICGRRWKRGSRHPPGNPPTQRAHQIPQRKRKNVCLFHPSLLRLRRWKRRKPLSRAYRKILVTHVLKLEATFGASNRQVSQVSHSPVSRNQAHARHPPRSAPGTPIERPKQLLHAIQVSTHPPILPRARGASSRGR